MTQREAEVFAKAKQLFEREHPKLRIEDQSLVCVSMWEMLARQVERGDFIP